jgi:hypothetical protein
MSKKCQERDRLFSEVENVLGNLAQVSTLLLELFRSRDLTSVNRLDRELELTKLFVALSGLCQDEGPRC